MRYGQNEFGQSVVIVPPPGTPLCRKRTLGEDFRDWGRTFARDSRVMPMLDWFSPVQAMALHLWQLWQRLRTGQPRCLAFLERDSDYQPHTVYGVLLSLLVVLAVMPLLVVLYPLELVFHDWEWDRDLKWGWLVGGKFSAE